MAITRIKNLGLDGTTVTVQFGTLTVPCRSVSGYGDSLSTEWVPNMGSQERGEQSPGTYAVEDLKIVVSTVRWYAQLLAALPKNGAGNLVVNLTISYSHPDLGTESDLLEGCRLIGTSGSIENSAKLLDRELTFSVAQVYHGERRATINKLDDVDQSTENGLGVA